MAPRSQSPQPGATTESASQLLSSSKLDEVSQGCTRVRLGIKIARNDIEGFKEEVPTPST